jgi:hypothetical protein
VPGCTFFTRVCRALVEFAIAHAYALAMHLDNTAKPPKPATPGTSIAS